MELGKLLKGSEAVFVGCFFLLSILLRLASLAPSGQADRRNRPGRGAPAEILVCPGELLVRMLSVVEKDL